MSRLLAIGILSLVLSGCKPATPAPVTPPAKTSPNDPATAVPAPPAAQSGKPATNGVSAAPGEPTARTSDSKWTMNLDPLTLVTNDGGLSITCEEAKKTLRINFVPAWELNGPFNNATIHFGDKSFPLKINAAAPSGPGGGSSPEYVVPADAAIVTAIMMATNARITMANTDGEQERKGEVTDDGTFDMFATTCAQMNGLR